jgi:hypothetical protein
MPTLGSLMGQRAASPAADLSPLTSPRARRLSLTAVVAPTTPERACRTRSQAARRRCPQTEGPHVGAAHRPRRRGALDHAVCTGDRDA